MLALFTSMTVEMLPHMGYAISKETNDLLLNTIVLLSTTCSIHGNKVACRTDITLMWPSQPVMIFEHIHVFIPTLGNLDVIIHALLCHTYMLSLHSKLDQVTGNPTLFKWKMLLGVFNFGWEVSSDR